MYKVEYLCDGKLARSDENKCELCKFESCVSTTCCRKNLCEWHLRNNGEHADQAYYSCESCETTTNVAENGYMRNYITVYCREHNKLSLCEKCDARYCGHHLDHECIEWVEVPPPPITKEERNAFIESHRCKT